MAPDIRLAPVAVLLTLAWTASADPAPTALADPRYLFKPAPQVTPSPTVRLEERQILSQIESFAKSLGGGAASYLSSVESGIPAWLASGVGLPTGSAVASSAGIETSTLSATPTSVLNLSPYANWTDQGWNVRFHGNVYKTPNISESKLEDLTNDFLIGTRVQDLPPAQSSMAINVTSEIFVIQQGNEQPVFQLSPRNAVGSQSQMITYPSYNTTPEGDYDAFLPIPAGPLDLQPGNTTDSIQQLDVQTQGTSTGNATAFLVPPQGLTIVSDIDDILRITKIWDPKQGILNTFAKPYEPWEDMPAIFSNWSSNLRLTTDGKTYPTHFHYLTTLPEQTTRQYETYIAATYPAGSFDTRPLNFSNADETFSVRRYLLDKIFQTYPQRKFVLVADTSNSDVMRDYPAMYHDYPGQVQCIFLRNTTSTDPSLKLPYDTSGFKGIPQDTYMFFVHSDDLTNLNVDGGQCWNQSIKQNVTFGEQGLPFGINLGSGGTPSGSGNGGPATSSGAAPRIAIEPYDRTLLLTWTAVILSIGVCGFAGGSLVLL